MNKYPEKTKAMIRALIEKGVGMAEIAKKHKVPYHVVVGVKAAGTKAPPAKKGRPAKVTKTEVQQALQTTQEPGPSDQSDSPAAKYFLQAERIRRENHYLRQEVHHLRSLVSHYMPTIIDSSTTHA